MQKSQILVLVLALALIGGLYSMPKVIVGDKNKVLATAASTSPAGTTVPEGVHNSTLTPPQREAIDKVRNAYLHSVDKEKKITFADSLADLYQQASFLDSSIAYREIVVELAPNVEHWMKAGDSYYEAFSFAVDAQKASKLGEKARAYYEKALEKDPMQLDAKAKIGMTYITTSNPMQGIKLLREVLEKDPANELALFNMGILSMQSGQYDKAVERFKQLVEINPDHTKAQFYLGISYAESGKKVEAIEVLQQVKQVDKDPMVQATVEEYLKKLK